MGNEKNERCIDGDRYIFVPDSESFLSGGSTDDSESAVASYLSQIVALLTPISQHFSTWKGVIISGEMVVPANSNRKKFSVSPAARTIRIESDSSANIWLNDDRGIPIFIGGDRRVLYLSDLPPSAAIHDIYVTCVGETVLTILAVA